MKRREFIAGAAAWPLAARAQQGERVRRIGVLIGADENDPEEKRRLSAFAQALADLGWTDGRNVRMDVRSGRGDTNRIRALAQELIGLQPDIIVTGSTPATVALQRATPTIPIVFTGVADPVVSGIVPRLDRPAGNITGFANLEASLGGKYLELLSEIAPGLKRAAIMFNPDMATASTYVPSLETAARSLKVVLIIPPKAATKAPDVMRSAAKTCAAVIEGVIRRGSLPKPDEWSFFDLSAGKMGSGGSKTR
jgi:putative ABC transport system substrate-binding protein